MGGTRRIAIALAVLVALAGSACGDDDSATAPDDEEATASDPGDAAGDGDGGGADDDDDDMAGSDDEGDGEETPSEPGSGGGAGTMTFGDETIEFEQSRCFLEPQEAAAGGGTIELTAQGQGTNAAGEPVLLDFARFDDESMFTGDDLTFDIGDPLGGDEDFVSYTARLDIGGVAVEGNVLSAEGVTFTNAEDGSEVSGSFRIEC